MATARFWLEAAQAANEAAGVLAEHGDARGAANRAYYSAYQAAHALLLTTPLSESIPDRGNWDHGSLMNAFYAALRDHFGYAPGAALDFRRRLSASQDTRVIADYGPGDVIDERSLRGSRRTAAAIISMARRRGIE